MFLSAFLALLFVSIPAASGAANLLNFANGDVGNVLGSAFGVPGVNATYDYVIVGGGTAGLTIATRLAEDPALKIAVVEAGGFYEVDNGNLSVTPGYSSFFTGADPNNFQPLVDWGFATVPQAGAAQRTVHYARGKTLGGSSARHYMAYHRPTKGALQKWADEVGDQSYSWDDFLPYYKKSVEYTPFNPARYTNATNKQDPSDFEPSGGPLQVSFSNHVDPFGTWAQKAFVSVGMSLLDGLNQGVLNGSAYGTLTIDPRNGYRSSSESSFLQAALQNGTSPTIYKNCLGLKIMFDANKTATGVDVGIAGFHGAHTSKFVLSARKEVIISSGVFQSPQLLMVSGIGPRDILEQNEIKVIKDLPGVGQNMWDHILYGINRRVNVLTASAGLNDPAVGARNAKLFRENGTGPLSIFGASFYGWEHLPEPYRSNLSESATSALASQFPSDWPELEWLGVSSYLGYQTNRQTEDPRDGYNYATVNTGLMQPLSRGNISISSSSMADPPIIDPAWLAHPVDKEMAIQSFRRQREVWNVIARAGGTVGNEKTLPPDNVTSDADILAYIQKSLMTIYHASSTCKMGKSDDEMAVIDNHARVYGVQNLRVVDASSFPFLPPGHPQSTVYALAEKIAADISAPFTTPSGYSVGGYEQDQKIIQANRDGR